MLGSGVKRFERPLVRKPGGGGVPVAHRVERVPLRLSPDRGDPGSNPDRADYCVSSPLSPIPSSLSHSIIKHKNAKINRKKIKKGAVYSPYLQSRYVISGSNLQPGPTDLHVKMPHCCVR